MSDLGIGVTSAFAAGDSKEHYPVPDCRAGALSLKDRQAFSTIVNAFGQLSGAAQVRGRRHLFSCQPDMTLHSVCS